MRRKWVLAIPVVVALGGIVLVVGIRGRAPATIEQHRSEILAVLANPVGEFRPGPGWETLLPALQAIWERDPWHGFGTLDSLKGDDPVLQAQPQLQACRRALENPTFEAGGVPDPMLPHWARQAATALVATSYQAWEQGRDADAVDGLIAALTLAQETERLGQQHARFDMLRQVEARVFEATRALLSRHALSAARLEDFERRLNDFRSRRPSPAAEFRRSGAATRAEFLDSVRGVGVVEADGELACVNLREPVRWKDLYSKDLRKARILNGLRDAAEQAGRLTWTSSADIEPQWAALCSRYDPDDVGLLWAGEIKFPDVLAAFLKWDFLRIAVALARVQAQTGTLPATVAEAGIDVRLGRPLTIQGDTVSFQLAPSGEPSVLRRHFAPSEEKWTLRRR